MYRFTASALFVMGRAVSEKGTVAQGPAGQGKVNSQEQTVAGLCKGTF